LSRGRRQIRVFLCDDAPEIRALTRCRLEHDPALLVVGEAGDGEAAVALIAQLCPDVVMLDLSMPNVDGLEALPRVRDAAPDARVIVYSGLAAHRVAAIALERGAHRYLEKGESAQRIREVVHEVAT
jgi:DNA-binding NarL/FixJ family response regulator